MISLLLSTFLGFFSENLIITETVHVMTKNTGDSVPRKQKYLHFDKEFRKEKRVSENRRSNVSNANRFSKKP